MKNKKLKIEGELPNKADLDYMEKAIQRHTGDFDTWWKQNCNELSGRDWLKLMKPIYPCKELNNG